MLTARERINAQLHHRETDRVPITDNPWFTTTERWHKEGLPDNMTAAEYFDFELYNFGFDGSLMLDKRIIDETDSYIIETNSNGATVKNWKHKTSTPELVAFELTTQEKWQELKPRLQFNKERIREYLGNYSLYNNLYSKDKFITIAFAMGYDELSCIVGPDILLPAMLTEPDWVYDMFESYMNLKIQCVEEILALGFKFDGAFLFDDLGYKNGVFFSTETYKELLFPHHKKVCDFLHSKGWKVILHSCGNIKQHVPALIEAGFDCLQPLEVKAGMDLVEMKKQYGEKLAFMGGIDVRAMADKDPAVIENEIKTKIPFAKKGGGYIYYSDHSIPDNVSFDQYKRVIELVQKYGKY